MTTAAATWKCLARALGLGFLAVALAGTGCAARSPDGRVARMPVIGAAPADDGTGGAAYCRASRHGHEVACGGAAAYCQQSPDGRAVSCGPLASYCEKSRDGKAVACGGRASYCEKSSDGKAVACGGRQWQ